MTYQHALSIPGRPKSGPSFPTSCKHKVPRNQLDQAVHADLSAQFRMGAIYAYSYQDGQWSTWATQQDWDATERATSNGRTIRNQAAHDAGHGPGIYQPAPTTRAKRPSKADYIALCQAILNGTDWQVSDLEALLARETTR